MIPIWHFGCDSNNAGPTESPQALLRLVTEQNPSASPGLVLLGERITSRRGAWALGGLSSAIPSCHSGPSCPMLESGREGRRGGLPTAAVAAVPGDCPAVARGAVARSVSFSAASGPPCRCPLVPGAATLAHSPREGGLRLLEPRLLDGPSGSTRGSTGTHAGRETLMHTHTHTCAHMTHWASPDAPHAAFPVCCPWVLQLTGVGRGLGQASPPQPSSPLLPAP